MAKSKTMLQDDAAMEHLSQLEVSRGLPKGILAGMLRTESGGRPNLTSTAGAKGYFQFMDATAKSYNLKDPNDFHDSARAAADYMRDNMQRYGSAELALVDYNGGPRAVKAYQAGKPYKESANYVQKVLGDSAAAPAAPEGFKIGVNRGTPTSTDRMPWQEQAEAGDSAQQEFLRQQALDKKFDDESFGDAVGRNWQDVKDAIVPNSPLFAGLAANENADPLGANYFTSDAKREEVQRRLENMSEGEADYLYSNATSDSHLDSLVAIAKMERDRQARMAESGIMATLGKEMAGSLFDPVGLVIGLGAGKVFQAGKVAHRVGRAATYAAEGAAANVATEALLSRYNPQADGSDLAMAAGVGGIFGSIGGAFSKHIGNANVGNEAGAVVRAMDAPMAPTSQFDVGPQRPADIGPLPEIKTTAPEAPAAPAAPQAPVAPTTAAPAAPAAAAPAPQAPEAPVEVPVPPPSMVRPGPDPEAPAAPAVSPDAPEAPEVPVGLDVPKPTKKKATKKKAADVAARWDENGHLMLPDDMNGSIDEVVSYISTNTKNPVLKRIVQRVWQTAKDRNLTMHWVKNPADMPLNVGGQHLNDRVGHSNIYIRHSDNPQLQSPSTFKGREEITFIHELVHGVTVENIKQILEWGVKAPPDLKKAVDELDSLYKMVKRVRNKRIKEGTASKLDLYGFSKYAVYNVKEFIAVGLTDPTVQKWLQTIPVKGEKTTVWGKFTQAVRKLAGMEKDADADAFTKLLELSDTVIGNTKWDEPSMRQDNLMDQVLTKDEFDAELDTWTRADFKDKEGEITNSAGKRFSTEAKLGGSESKIMRWASQQLLNAHAGYKNKLAIRKPSAVELAGDLNNSKKRQVQRVVMVEWKKYVKERKLNKNNVTEFNNFEKQVHAEIVGLDLDDISPQAKAVAQRFREILKDDQELINDPGRLVDKALPGLTQRPYTPPEEVDVAKEVGKWVKAIGVVEDKTEPLTHALTTLFRLGTTHMDQAGLEKKLELIKKMGFRGINPKTLSKEMYNLMSLNDIAVRDKGKKFTDPLPPNERYFPRIWDEMKLAEHGKERFELWLVGAIKSANRHLTDEQLDKVGKLMVKKIIDGKVRGMNDAHLQLATNDLSMLRHDLLEAGLEWGEINDILKPLADRKTPEAGSPRLKHRGMINENFKMEIEGKSYTMQDFVNTNVTEVLESYHRRVHGDVVLAAKLNVYNETDLQKLKNQIREEIDVDTEYGKKMADSEIKTLNFVIDELRGINAENWTPAVGGASIVKKAIFADLGGMMFTNSIGEMSRIMGVLGWKSIRYLPAVMKVLRDAETGNLKDADLQAMENVFGGTDGPLMDRLTMTNFDQFSRNMKNKPVLAANLDKLDKWTTAASNFVANMGLNQVLVGQKRWAYKAIVGHWRNQVMTNGKMGQMFSNGRMREWGLESEDFDKINAMLHKHSKKTKGSIGNAYETDYHAWELEDQKSYLDFMRAVHRQGQRIVLENDISSSHEFLGTAMGGIMAQFRVFVVNSYDQGLMNAAHQRDMMAFTMFLSGAIGAATMYIANTYYRSLGREDAQEYRDKRLTAANIVKVGLFRTSEAAVLAMLNDTINPFWKTSADLGRTTVQGAEAGDILFGNPFVNQLNNATGMGKLLRNGLFGDEQTNQQQARSAASVIPFLTVAPMIPVANALIAQFPKNNEQ